MYRFGFKLIQCLSSHPQRCSFTNKFQFRSTHKILFTVFSLSYDRSKHTYQFVKHKPKLNSRNSHFRYTKQLQPKHPLNRVLSDDSKPDEEHHYTIAWLIGKFFAKVAAIIIGRSLKNIFWSLSAEERQSLLNSFHDHRNISCTISGILFTVACLYYFSHIEETPITKRRRFVTFSLEEEAEIAQFQADFLIDAFKKYLIVGEDARVIRALNVCKKIINANPEAKIRNKWRVYVINDSFANAFVLSTGHIFIFKGILNLSTSDDQLAIVLGHEMAHAVMNHSIEALSLSSFIDWFLMLGFAVIWFVVQHDIFDILATFLFDKIVNLLIIMPKSRRLEWEADHVGLIFAANACYDVREAGTFFRKIATLQEKKRSVSLPAWMESHPDSRTRAEYLDSLFVDAEGWRKANGCPPLSKDNHGPRTQ